MGRPSLGQRSVSASSCTSINLQNNIPHHHHFTRSAALGVVTATSLPATPQLTCVEDLPLPAVSSERNTTITPTQPIPISKKKTSLWSKFTKRPRKSNPTESKNIAADDLRVVSCPIPSTLGIEIIAHKARPGQESQTIPSNQRFLRAQRSLHTLHSQNSLPTLRSVRSQYLRRPSGLQFDSDSVFSDDSESSVSWVTPGGLKRVGMDFDNEDEAIMLLDHQR